MNISSIGSPPVANLNQRKNVPATNGDFQKWMSEAKNGKMGFAYIDQYGFSHVVSDYQTAQKYAKPNTEVYLYHGEYGGGYAKSEDGKRLAVPLPGFVPYGNEDPAIDAPVLTKNEFEQAYPNHIVGLAKNFMDDYAFLFQKSNPSKQEVLEGDKPFSETRASFPSQNQIELAADIKMKEQLEKMMFQVKNPYNRV